MASHLTVSSIFLKCQDYTLDPFWKEMFSSCAYNKFPKGVKYDKSRNYVYIKYPGTNRREFFSLSSNPEEVFRTMMRVFRSLGLRSQRDLQINKEEMEEIRKERYVDLNCTWKDLKPKYLKDRMVVDYVLRLRNKHDLSLKETKRLLNTIQLGFQLKQLSNDDVDYQDRQIQSIKGLKIQDKKFVLLREVQRSNKNTKSSSNDPFLQIFENYLKEAKKHRLRF